MEAIEILMTEHRLIERVCDALAVFAEGAARKPVDEKAELARFVKFIRGFADGHHHGKEEDILFAAMVEAGFPREAGPIGVMLIEHDRGRRFVGALARLAEQAAPWSEDDRRTLVEAGNGFADLLHSHIHKEDAILYPMAEQRLPPEALERVNEACIQYESRQGDGELDALLLIGQELVARHAPGAPPRRPVPMCG